MPDAYNMEGEVRNEMWMDAEYRACRAKGIMPTEPSTAEHPSTAVHPDTTEEQRRALQQTQDEITDLKL